MKSNFSFYGHKFKQSSKIRWVMWVSGARAYKSLLTNYLVWVQQMTAAKEINIWLSETSLRITSSGGAWKLNSFWQLVCWAMLVSGALKFNRFLATIVSIRNILCAMLC